MTYISNSTPIYVLLIEDNQADANLIKTSIGDKDMPQVNLVCESTLAGGLERISADNQPDLILLDLGLPDSKGLETLRTILSHTDLPVIVLSGTEDEGLVNQALKEGAQDYIMKRQLHTAVLNYVLRYAVERHQLTNMLTERLHAQRVSEINLRNIIHSTLEGIVIIDHDGFIRYINPAGIEIFGRDVEDLISEQFGFPISTGRATEIEIIRPGSGPVIAEMKAVEIEWEDDTAFLVSLHDMTAHRRMEDQLRQVQKMEEVGRLASGVSHEFNNLMTVVNGFAEMLMNNLGKDDPLYDQAQEIRQAGIRAAQVAQQLLAFSRRQTMEFKLVDLNRLINDDIKMLYRLIGEDIQLVTTLTDQPAFIRADPVQLGQVIINLAVNARDAMPTGGTLFITTDCITLTQIEAEQTVGLKAGPYVRLMVRDTGSGISSVDKTHIFEPFYTTKEVGKGTGLGLSTVQGIVQQSGGVITVESEADCGTQFTICLPQVIEDNQTATPEAERAPHEADQSTAQEKTVLVVEDEPEVRRLAATVLENADYKVLEAASGPEALALALQHSAPIDILLTDVVMPQMSGYNLARQMDQYHPGIRVIYISGYMETDLIRYGIDIDDIILISKPFKPHHITETIESVLAS